MTTFSNMDSLLQWSSVGVSLPAPKLGETALWEFRLDAERELWEKVYRVFYNAMAFFVFQYITIKMFYFVSIFSPPPLQYLPPVTFTFLKNFSSLRNS